MNLRKDHYRETSLFLASPISKNNSHFARPFLSREGLAGSDRHPCTTRPVNLGRAIRAAPAAAFRRRDEPPGPATGGLTTPPLGAVSRWEGLQRGPGECGGRGNLASASYTLSRRSPPTFIFAIPFLVFGNQCSMDGKSRN